MDADDLYPRRPSGRGGVALVTEQAVVWLQLLGGPPSLLTGMEFDEEGQRLTPTHAVKKGTRYRYYVPTSLITGAGGGARRGGGRRIPAGDLEGLVIARLRAFFADPGAILDAIDNETHNGSGCGELIERGRQLAEEFSGENPMSCVFLACRRAGIWTDCPVHVAEPTGLPPHSTHWCVRRPVDLATRRHD